jgi:hypothetical protein
MNGMSRVNLKNSMVEDRFDLADVSALSNLQVMATLKIP